MQRKCDLLEAIIHEAGADGGDREQDGEDGDDFQLEGEFHEDGLDTVQNLSGAAAAAGARNGLQEADVEEDLEEGEEEEEGAADLEFEYEPGISLSNLAFGQHGAQLLEASCWPGNCLFCGVDYETGT